MKKSIGILISVIAAIFFSFRVVPAQEDQPDTVVVELSVVDKDLIKINPMDTTVKQGDRILFYTKDTHTFTVLIDNYDHFFDNPVTPLMFIVTAEDSVMLIIGTPPKADIVKYYSVGVVNPKKPVPLPPEAPPKIILRSTQ